ncbi:hypothetical protein A0J61_02873 [Choanephora cucurbitarum]|uniref:Uncharacterized protein n=1 Tax=Choanephora cucurbitarum TaxID=101091 RepID=A0A1C7NJW0_9FUNG|nr:hypothetical protein A0J61_02873 [Choanephora cucurbitarum]
MSNESWFYIRSSTTGNVISAPTDTDELLRAQVLVTPPTLSDNELWCWKGRHLCNKASGLVLDIRKGRLRLIEDTEICLFTPKPEDEAHNQLWSVKEDSSDAFGNQLPGKYIYSTCNYAWVLDAQATDEGHQKLVLFPLQPIDNDSQRWLFVPEGQLDLSLSIKDVLSTTKHNTAGYFNHDMITPPGSMSTSPGNPSVDEYPRGLSPAKRGSHSSIFSLETFKDYHRRIYDLQDTHVSDKGIAMASAYHIFQNWKLDQINNDTMTSFPLSSPSEVRTRLQVLTQEEVAKLLSNSLYANNNKDTASALSSRLITQLYDQTPISP